MLPKLKRLTFFGGPGYCQSLDWKSSVEVCDALLLAPSEGLGFMA